MVEFVDKFDFLASLSEYLKKQAEDLSIEEINPKIVGSERSGLLLYAWHKKQTRRPSAWKTLVSVFDTNTHTSKILFTHNDKIDIVHASVNQTLIILAFTVREKQVDNESTDGSKNKADIFKSYIAEIAPQKRVFSLNIEWHTFQKVQFLYHTDRPVKEIYMLFIHHKESIGLYCIPVAKLGDNGIVMSSQPKTDQIVREFLWSKFDPMEQRLFYVQLRAQDEEEEEGALTFNAIQFDDRGKYSYILTFQLPVSFRMELMREKVQYYDRYITSCLANMNLNIETITSNRGVLMICYQHLQEITSESRNSTPRIEDETLSLNTIQSNCNVSYTVFCIHSGYSLTCSVSLNVEIAIKSQIVFTMFGDYLMVLLPGHFLHLLDCGSEHEPVHHIFLSESDCPMGPRIPSKGTLLSTATWDMLPSMQHGTILYENFSQKSYKVSFNHKYLVKIFCTSRHASKRMAILHAAIVHMKDLRFSKKLIECLCQDPANLECSDLMKEYLIASSYAHIKQHLGCAFQRPFAFTGLDSFRGHLERDRENHRAVNLRYKRFGKETIDAILYLLKDKDMDYWAALKLALKLSQDVNIKRFPLSSLPDLLERATPKTAGVKKDAKLPTGATALTFDGSHKAASDATKRSDEGKVGDDPLSQFIVQNMSAHLLKCFPRESKGRVQNICIEYAHCRGRVVRSLWRCLTKVLGYSQESDVYSHPLEKTSKATDFALFQMLERLYINIKQLCFPQFRGMENVFIALGYRCLPNYLFKQYFRLSVFTASPEFISRFVTEVPEDEQSSALKLDLITSLPKEAAKPIISKWNHPAAKRFMVQELVGRFDFIGMFNVSSSMMLGASEGGEESGRFLPTESFLRLISLPAFASSRLTEDEWEFLVSSAHSNLDNLTLR